MSRLKELNTPIFWIEGHPGKLQKEKWTVEVSGLCKNHEKFNWHQLMEMPKSIVEARLTSVTRFSVFGRWGGIKIGDLLKLVGIDQKVKYIRFWSYRMIYDTSIPIEIALREKTLLAYEFDNEPLEEDYGGPIRGFCPYLWGYKSAKSVVKIELMDHYIPGYWEKRGYSDDAQITKGKVLDLNSGRLRPIPDGEVIRFLD